MKIIVKKSYSTSRDNSIGFVIPIFKKSHDNYVKIEEGEYPNNGNIFVTSGFNGFEANYFYEFNSERLQENNNYENDLAEFLENKSTKNPSRKILSYYHNSEYIRKVSPNNFISVYTNKFSLSTNKLHEIEGVNSEIFFLKNIDLDKIFGPFKRNGTELESASFKSFEDEFEGDENFIDFIDKYREYDGNIIFELSITEASNFLVADNEGFEYLENFETFIDNKIGKPIDFTPIASLHKWAIEKLNVKAPQISKTLDEIKNIQNQYLSVIDKLKWSKYISHLEVINEEEEDIEELVRVLKEKKFINLEVDNSSIEKLQREIIEINGHLDIKSKAIISLKDANLELKNEIEESKNKTQINNTVDSVEYPNLTKILESSVEIRKIEDLIVSQKKLGDFEREYYRLEGKKDNLDQQVNKLEKTKIETRDTIQAITNGFKTDAKDYTARLAEVKIYTDLLNGIEISPSSSKSHDSKAKEVQIINPNDKFSNAKAYILEIQKQLFNDGRNIEFNDVANLVITINQTFITIIAGAPGVGKTSLVEKLAKSYGLNEQFGYLEIACAKGWTSSKDLIGFFNPLTNKFQSSKTRLRESLIDSEAHSNSPYIVLLDEANLSPIEHYWSDFIKLADFNNSRKIRISGNEEINFGQGFRFLATINHDHTTEALSNRLLDRAAIIQLEKPDELLEINEVLDHVNTIYDFTEIEKLFSTTSKWKSEEESIKDTLENIIKKIESNYTGIIISPRKKIAIEKYCKVATGLLEGSSYTALDYSVSQHILPLINGRGEDFEILMRSLKKDFNDKGMTKSEKLLNKIIERGKGLRHFRYIYY
jgi:MoxR-like ATPase